MKKALIWIGIIIFVFAAYPLYLQLFFSSQERLELRFAAAKAINTEQAYNSFTHENVNQTMWTTADAFKVGLAAAYLSDTMRDFDKRVKEEAWDHLEIISQTVAERFPDLTPSMNKKLDKLYAAALEKTKARLARDRRQILMTFDFEKREVRMDALLAILGTEDDGCIGWWKPAKKQQRAKEATAFIRELKKDIPETLNVKLTIRDFYFVNGEAPMKGYDNKPL